MTSLLSIPFGLPPRPLAAVFCTALILAAALVSPASAQPYETDARSAYLIDYKTGTVLFEKNPDGRVPPASLAKLMTMAVVFQALKEGELDRDDEFVVSEHAWRTGGAVARGSTMFAELGSSIRAEDLIRGAIVQSGNDSCIILAEGMAGSEEAFADLMNKEAQRLGMVNSHFENSTGLPSPGQYVSARDLAILANHMIREHPDLYSIFAEPDFTWNKIFQKNRNPLLAMNIGADGLKTGFTEESGYGIVGSTVRDGQRLIAVIGGAETDKARASEVRRLLDWGYREFELVRLFDDGEVIAEAKVYGGDSRSVGVIGKGGVELLMPVTLTDQVKAEIVYQGPVVAPIEAGLEIGIVRFTTAEGMSKEQAIFAVQDVGVGSMSQRALDGLEELLLGWW